MNSVLSSQTQSAQPVAFITALVVTTLLLLVAIPAIAQAQELIPTSEELTPTSEQQAQQPAPTQEPTPTPEEQEQQPAPTQEPTKTVGTELSFSQTAWAADETDADGALTTVNINPALTEAGPVNIKTSPNAALFE